MLILANKHEDYIYVYRNINELILKITSFGPVAKLGFEATEDIIIDRAPIYHKKLLALNKG